VCVAAAQIATPMHFCGLHSDVGSEHLMWL